MADPWLLQSGVGTYVIMTFLYMGHGRWLTIHVVRVGGHDNTDNS